MLFAVSAFHFRHYGIHPELKTNQANVFARELFRSSSRKLGCTGLSWTGLGWANIAVSQRHSWNEDKIRCSFDTLQQTATLTHYYPAESRTTFVSYKDLHWIGLYCFPCRWNREDAKKRPSNFDKLSDKTKNAA